MKKYYIVEIKGNPILFIGKKTKVKEFAKIREGEYRFPTDVEKTYIIENRLQHLTSVKLAGEVMEVEDEPTVNVENELTINKDLKVEEVKTGDPKVENVDVTEGENKEVKETTKPKSTTKKTPTTK